MNKTNMFIDIGLLIAFLICSAPHFTGNQIHEWLGVALAVSLFVHILIHWEWIITCGLNFFKGLWQLSRVQLVVDILIFIVFITLIASGLAMSKNVMSMLGIPLFPSLTWKIVHSTVSNIAVILTAIHIALNWSWISCMVKRCILLPVFSLIHSGRKPNPILVDNPEEK